MKSKIAGFYHATDSPDGYYGDSVSYISLSIRPTIAADA